MKTCFKCDRRLPLSEFYRHPRMADGLLSKCKKCTRADVQKNYLSRREQYLEYEQSRYNEQRKESIRRSRQRHPTECRARIALHTAVKRGKVVKPEICTECGVNARLDGHHEDYSKPLEVIWLCRPCHMKRHRMEMPHEQSARPF